MPAQQLQGHNLAEWKQPFWLCLNATKSSSIGVSLTCCVACIAVRSFNGHLLQAAQKLR